MHDTAFAISSKLVPWPLLLPATVPKLTLGPLRNSQDRRPCDKDFKRLSHVQRVKTSWQLLRTFRCEFDLKQAIYCDCRELNCLLDASLHVSCPAVLQISTAEFQQRGLLLCRLCRLSCLCRLLWSLRCFWTKGGINPSSMPKRPHEHKDPAVWSSGPR